MSLLTDNPVLIKEVRSRLRARRQSRNARIGAFIAIGAVIALVYFYSLMAFLDQNAHLTGEGLYSFFNTGLEMTMVLFMTPSLAAAAITQEREQQTWNALLLSRLTPGEIVVGKFISSLLPALILLVIFAPLKLLASFFGNIDPFRYLLADTLLLLTACFCTAISLFWSWACRRTYIATSAAFGSVAFLVIGTLILYGLFALAFAPSHFMQLHEFPLMWINPYLAMGVATDSGSNNPLGVSIFCCVAYLLGTIGLLVIVTRRLARGPKELEQ